MKRLLGLTLALCMIACMLPILPVSAAVTVEGWLRNPEVATAAVTAVTEGDDAGAIKISKTVTTEENTGGEIVTLATLNMAPVALTEDLQYTLEFRIKTENRLGAERWGEIYLMTGDRVLYALLPEALDSQYPSQICIETKDHVGNQFGGTLGYEGFSRPDDGEWVKLRLDITSKGALTKAVNFPSIFDGSSWRGGYGGNTLMGPLTAINEMYIGYKPADGRVPAAEKELAVYIDDLSLVAHGSSENLIVPKYIDEDAVPLTPPTVAFTSCPESVNKADGTMPVSVTVTPDTTTGEYTIDSVTAKLGENGVETVLTAGESNVYTGNVSLASTGVGTHNLIITAKYEENAEEVSKTAAQAVAVTYTGTGVSANAVTFDLSDAIANNKNGVVGIGIFNTDGAEINEAIHKAAGNQTGADGLGSFIVAPPADAPLSYTLNGMTYQLVNASADEKNSFYVYGVDAEINVPNRRYDRLGVLLMNGKDVLFRVNYADGTDSTQLPDYNEADYMLTPGGWWNVAATSNDVVEFTNRISGGTLQYGTARAYAFDIPVDPTKVVDSITVVDNHNNFAAANSGSQMYRFFRVLALSGVGAEGTVAPPPANPVVDGFDGWVANADAGAILRVADDPSRGELLEVTKDVARGKNPGTVTLATKTLAEPIPLVEGESLQFDFSMMADGIFDEGNRWAEVQLYANNQIIYRITPGNATNTDYYVMDKGGWHGGGFKTDVDAMARTENGKWYKLRLDMSRGNDGTIGTSPSILLNGQWIGGWGGAKFTNKLTEISSFTIKLQPTKTPISNKEVKVQLGKINIHKSGEQNNMLPAYGNWSEYDNYNPSIKSNALESYVSHHVDETRGDVVRITKPITANENAGSTKLATYELPEPVTITEGTNSVIEFWAKMDGKVIGETEWAELNLWVNDGNVMGVQPNGSLMQSWRTLFNTETPGTPGLRDGEWCKFKLVLKETSDPTKFRVDYYVKQNESALWVKSSESSREDIAVGTTINSLTFTYTNKWGVKPPADGLLSICVDDLSVGANKLGEGFDGWRAWENIPVDSENINATVEEATEAGRDNVVMISKAFDTTEHTNDAIVKLATKTLDTPIVVPNAADNNPAVVDFWVKVEGRSLEDKWADMMIMINDQMCYSMNREFAIGRDGGGVFAADKNMTVADGTWVHINASLSNGTKSWNDGEGNPQSAPVTWLATKARFDDANDWTNESWGGGQVAGAQISTINSISIGYKNSWLGSTWPKPQSAGTLKVYVDDLTVTGTAPDVPDPDPLTPPTIAITAPGVYTSDDEIAVSATVTPVTTTGEYTISSVTAKLGEDGTPVALTAGADNNYTGTLSLGTLAAGSYNIIVTATYGDGETKSETQSFTVTAAPVVADWTGYDVIKAMDKNTPANGWTWGITSASQSSKVEGLVNAQTGHGDGFKISKIVDPTEWLSFSFARLATKNYETPLPVLDDTATTFSFWIKTEGRDDGVKTSGAEAGNPAPWANAHILINDEPVLALMAGNGIGRYLTDWSKGYCEYYTYGQIGNVPDDSWAKVTIDVYQGVYDRTEWNGSAHVVVEPNCPATLMNVKVETTGEGATTYTYTKLPLRSRCYDISSVSFGYSQQNGAGVDDALKFAINVADFKATAPERPIEPSLGITNEGTTYTATYTEAADGTVKNAKVIIAAFDGSGNLVNISVSAGGTLATEGNVRSASASLNATADTAYVKAYAWESVSSIKPIIEATAPVNVE